MNLLDLVTGNQNSGVVDQLAAQFGLAPNQANAAVGALMPALAAGLQKNMSTEAGLAGLLGALSGGGHASYLENPKSLSDPSATADGNGILGHILGSKEVSRQVAANASQRTGIDPAILKKMLPVVAAVVMGGLAKSKVAKTAEPRQSASGLASMLGPLLDKDRDGSLIDDLAGGLLGGLFRPR
jgi:hypothetical protein